ncbi:MAG: OsmC family protein [Betaproteobacteria bacterium]
MSEHKATVEWNLQGAFDYKTYSRTHSVDFGNGIVVAGNAAAGNVPPTVPAAHGVDPEQAFVASLSTCHMLWFLHLASRAKFTVTRYVDEASGVLEKGPQGKWMMTRVTLRPAVSFSGTAPAPEEHEQLHHKAHEECYVANSVKSEVICLPTIS